MTNNIDLIITRIVDQLKELEGLEAIVLSGSRARGTHSAQSDIDLGLYYLPEHPIDRKQLSEIATTLDDLNRRDIITAVGEWGPWINGGGWLNVSGVAVDFLYRDLEKVHEVINQCLSGKLNMDYQPGHPHGFCSSTYLGEMMICKPLWDPKHQISLIKSRISTYPDALQKAIIDKFLWEIEFSLDNAVKGVDKSDVSYVAGHLFRAVSCLTQVIFALNRQYLINEKGAVHFCAQLDMCPEQFDERVQLAFSLVNADKIQMNKGIETVNLLKDEVLEMIKINEQ